MFWSVTSRTNLYYFIRKACFVFRPRVLLRRAEIFLPSCILSCIHSHPFVFLDTCKVPGGLRLWYIRPELLSVGHTFSWHRLWNLSAFDSRRSCGMITVLPSLCPSSSQHQSRQKTANYSMSTTLFLVFACLFVQTIVQRLFSCVLDFHYDAGFLMLGLIFFF